jgi:microcompartment protein CcmK/EutM
MLLGRVAGTVVATNKEPRLDGLRFHVVDELDVHMRSTGKMVVAVDAVGAGAGEVVLIAQGSSARQTEATKDKPVDAVIMAIVDLFEVDGELRFRK